MRVATVDCGKMNTAICIFEVPLGNESIVFDEFKHLSIVSLKMDDIKCFTDKVISILRNIDVCIVENQVKGFTTRNTFQSSKYILYNNIIAAITIGVAMSRRILVVESNPRARTKQTREELSIYRIESNQPNRYNHKHVKQLGIEL